VKVSIETVAPTKQIPLCPIIRYKNDGQFYIHIILGVMVRPGIFHIPSVYVLPEVNAAISETSTV